MSDEGRRTTVSGPEEPLGGEAAARVEELRRHLRSSLPEPPLAEVAWDDLARSIAARAEPRLRLRRRPWWIHASRWGRVGVPVAAAAVVALALLLPGRRPTPTEPAAAASGADVAAGLTLTHEATDPVLTFLSASDDGEVLLLAALEEE